MGDTKIVGCSLGGGGFRCYLTIHIDIFNFYNMVKRPSEARIKAVTNSECLLLQLEAKQSTIVAKFIQMLPTNLTTFVLVLFDFYIDKFIAHS